MKFGVSILASAFLALSACSEREPEAKIEPAHVAAAPTQPSRALHNGPESTKGPAWQSIVNNAHRTAEAYAVSRNPSAVFFGPNADVSFIEQFGGEYQGRYLLQIVNRHAGNTSLIVLLPLFDENQPSDDLDDEGDLWRVVKAKYNGKEF